MIGWTQPALAAGTLRVAVPSTLNTLDTAKTKIGEEYIVNFLVFGGLTAIGRDDGDRARHLGFDLVEVSPLHDSG